MARKPCPRCNGTGISGGLICLNCTGRGHIMEGTIETCPYCGKGKLQVVKEIEGNFGLECNLCLTWFTLLRTRRSPFETKTTLGI